MKQRNQMLCLPLYAKQEVSVPRNTKWSLLYGDQAACSHFYAIKQTLENIPNMRFSLLCSFFFVLFSG